MLKYYVKNEFESIWNVKKIISIKVLDQIKNMSSKQTGDNEVENIYLLSFI